MNDNSKSLQRYEDLSEMQVNDLVAKASGFICINNRWRSVGDKDIGERYIQGNSYYDGDYYYCFTPVDNLDDCQIAEREGVGKAFASQAYVDYLIAIIGESMSIPKRVARESVRKLLIFPLLQATPDQRCRAMLMAAGLVRPIELDGGTLTMEMYEKLARKADRNEQ